MKACYVSHCFSLDQTKIFFENALLCLMPLILKVDVSMPPEVKVDVSLPLELKWIFLNLQNYRLIFQYL
jgi:hypothetical protein